MNTIATTEFVKAIAFDRASRDFRCTISTAGGELISVSYAATYIQGEDWCNAEIYRLLEDGYGAAAALVPTNDGPLPVAPVAAPAPNAPTPATGMIVTNHPVYQPMVLACSRIAYADKRAGKVAHAANVDALAVTLNLCGDAQLPEAERLPAAAAGVTSATFPAIVTNLTPYEKSIIYNHDCGDYDCYVDSMYAGSADTYHQGERRCDDFIYDLVHSGLIGSNVLHMSDEQLADAQMAVA